MVLGPILFLDLARQMGWCEGEPGLAHPASGSIRLAPSEDGQTAAFVGLYDFLRDRLTTFRYQSIWYEAPLDPRWKGMATNPATTAMLFGLPAIVRVVAHKTRHFNVRSEKVGVIRRGVFGKSPVAAEAKGFVMDELAGRGFHPRDDNEADAIAGWLYACDYVLARSKPPPRAA